MLGALSKMHTTEWRVSATSSPHCALEGGKELLAFVPFCRVGVCFPSPDVGAHGVRCANDLALQRS